jgi:hypothetical protein
MRGDDESEWQQACAVYLNQTEILKWLHSMGHQTIFARDPSHPRPSQSRNEKEETPPTTSFLFMHKDLPCPYCENPMSGPMTPRAPTRDHVRPRHLGGKLDETNRLIVCAKCNNDKGGRTLEQFAEWLTATHDRRAAIVWRIVTLRKYRHTETADATT